jgi:hypothetical protein
LYADEVIHPAVADIEAFDNGETPETLERPKTSAALAFWNNPKALY